MELQYIYTSKLNTAGVKFDTHTCQHILCIFTPKTEILQSVTVHVCGTVVQMNELLTIKSTSWIQLPSKWWTETKFISYYGLISIFVVFLTSTHFPLNFLLSYQRFHIAGLQITTDVATCTHTPHLHPHLDDNPDFEVKSSSQMCQDPYQWLTPAHTTHTHTESIIGRIMAHF